jgi:predicted DNA-binding transcriptional regulator AlpA
VGYTERTGQWDDLPRPSSKPGTPPAARIRHGSRRLHRRTTPPASDPQHTKAPAPPALATAPPIGAGGDPVFDPLLTIDQLAHWLGKPKGTLYQWRSRSMGPRGIKVGNDLRYRRSEVEAYLDANTDKRDSA